MKQGREPQVLPPNPLGEDARRLVLYVLREPRDEIPAHARRALAALRPHAARLVVVVTGAPDTRILDAAAELADDVVLAGAMFAWSDYARALEAPGNALGGVDELLLTGDGWYGPGEVSLSGVFARMRERAVHAWELVEDADHASRGFEAQGFPAREEPALWTAVRAAAFDTDLWRTSGAERGLLERAADRGLVAEAVFDRAGVGSDSPGLLGVGRLIAAGSPILPRRVFTLYPPYLQQHAVIGREILRDAETRGFAVDEMLRDLTRTVAPKALTTTLGMLEILTDAPEESPAPRRIAAIAHISDLEAADALWERLDTLPEGYDLIVTTTDGTKAARLNERLRRRRDPRFAALSVRVSPANRGRDMSDLFITCRDVILNGDYDLIVKVHARPMRRKTGAVRRYFRRYQWENLLGSRDQVAAILRLFDREDGLGLVFPPMMHIGYQTMGKAWSDYRDGAELIADQLGIRVPRDQQSPLAPYGGMWFARPAALAPMARHAWTYRDYGRAGRRRYHDLARLQERMVVLAAAEQGLHSRTVLVPEHAQISHTALEYKVDQLFSTTEGYPVDQITLVQRAGRTGYGGIVGLSRMYLRLNHRHLSRVLLPVLDVAENGYRLVRGTFGSDPRFARTRKNRWEEER